MGRARVRENERFRYRMLFGGLQLAVKLKSCYWWYYSLQLMSFL